MTDNTQELGEILNRLHQQYEMEFGMHKKPVDMTKVKQALLDWNNKKVEAELEALRKEVKHEDLRTISQIITARIDKLKEQTNE